MEMFDLYPYFCALMTWMALSIGMCTTIWFVSYAHVLVQETLWNVTPTVAALSFFGAAAEKAAKDSSTKGPVSFKLNFHDALTTMTVEEFVSLTKVEEFWIHAWIFRFYLCTCMYNK